MMRVILDTNLMISALLYGGIPRQVYQAGLAGKYRVLTAQPLLDELRVVLLYPKFTERIARSALTVDELIAVYKQTAEFVVPTAIAEEVIRDPKDLKFLACAVGGNATHIVTGDQDLLTLHPFQSVAIVLPADFLPLIAE